MKDYFTITIEVDHLGSYENTMRRLIERIGNMFCDEDGLEYEVQRVYSGSKTYVEAWDDIDDSYEDEDELDWED